MSTSWLLTNFIAAFLLPPLSLLIVALTGLAMLKQRALAGRSLIGAGLLGLWLLSTPLVAGWLLDSLKPAPLALHGGEADAIVILGGGRNKASAEYDGDTLGRYSIERVRYGAWLAKRLGKPILVTGGSPDGGSKSEAEIMADALRDEFGVATRWMESHSRNTRENARNSAEMLDKTGIRRIYLVTHSWHLARAIPEFEAMGLRVVPAGTGYSLDKEISPLDFLPSAGALNQSHLAIHEWIGGFWYRIRN